MSSRTRADSKGELHLDLLWAFVDDGHSNDALLLSAQAASTAQLLSPGVRLEVQPPALLEQAQCSVDPRPTGAQFAQRSASRQHLFDANG